jgi:RNA polymerase sigma-70 factor (ECF subfamily)
MPEEPDFATLLGRVRAGDAEAAAELVRRYEPAVRLEAHYRLRDRRVRQVVDSQDVCQLVLASFFVHVALGQYELNEPRDLIRLLVKMAQNKAARVARDQHRLRRDAGRVEAGEAAMDGVAAAGPSPSEAVAAREMLAEIRLRLSAEERRLADLRGQGREWAEIAAEMGGTPQGRRKQLERALERVGGELGLATDEEAPSDEP